MSKFLLALLALPLFGQAPPPPAAPMLSPAVQMFLPQTGFTLVLLDPSIIIDTTGPLPMLRVFFPPTPPAPVWIRNEALAVTDVLPTWTLANTLVAGTQAVYRNGLRLTPGLDYTVAGNVITFAVAAVPQAGDNLLADYRSQ